MRLAKLFHPHCPSLRYLSPKSSLSERGLTIDLKVSKTRNDNSTFHYI